MPMVQTGFSLNSAGVVFDMAVNGSVTQQEFSVTCPADIAWLVHTIEIIAVDDGIQPGRFLGQATLTNGINLITHNGDPASPEFDFLAATLPDGAMKKTEDLLAGAFSEFNLFETPGGAVDDMIHAQLHSGIVSSAAVPLTRLLPGEHISFLINDDLSTVTSFRAKAIVIPVPLRHGGT